MTRRTLAPILYVVALVACNAASHPAAPNGPPVAPAAPLEVLAVYEHRASAGVTYTLFANGTFTLRYGNAAEYSGTYNRADFLYAFDFGNGGVPGWCTEAWCRVRLAMGVVRTDTLRVEYDHATTWLLCNDMMDHEVCNYRRALYVRGGSQR